MGMTIGEAVARILPLQADKLTVDGLEWGDPSAPVKRIAVAFTASMSVLEQAISSGADLLVVHEGICYSHDSAADWSRRSREAERKRRWIQQAGLAICRYHDAPHRQDPDWITEGLIAALGWERGVEAMLPTAAVVRLQEQLPAAAIVEHVKRRLGLEWLRGMGDLASPCEAVGLAVGYRGGGAILAPLYEEYGADLVLAGEGPEWEMPEYIRDAASMGQGKSLLLLGHAASEEPGMRLTAQRIQEMLPAIPVSFIPGDSSFMQVL